MSIRSSLVALAVVLLCGVAGCTTSTPFQAPGDTGIPQTWLDATAEGWPLSDGYTASMPVLGRGECVAYDGRVTIAGARPKVTDVGYGAIGRGDREHQYRYICELWNPDHYAGRFQLVKVPDEATGDEFVTNSMDDRDTSVQINDTTVVTSRGLDVHVLKRWYPTNPQGMYTAIYFDRQRLALVALEINSLSESDFARYTESDIAADLAAILAAA